MLVSMPPSIALSKLVQYIKGKSSRKLFQEFQQLRKRYWGQHLWARGYFAVTVEYYRCSKVHRGAGNTPQQRY